MHRRKPLLFVLVAVPTTAAAVWAWKRWGEPGREHPPSQAARVPPPVEPPVATSEPDAR